MKALLLAVIGVGIVLVTAPPALAQVTSGASANGPNSALLSGAALGAGLGAGIIMIGAGWGFGRIGAAALESMARQPEVANRVQVAMIIIAALLEGATFFGLLICFILGGKALW